MTAVSFILNVKWTALLFIESNCGDGNKIPTISIYYNFNFKEGKNAIKRQHICIIYEKGTMYF